MKNLFLIFLIIFGNELFSQNYYVYVAAESDDVVSLIKFDGEISEEIDRIDVGIMPTEIEGPHGITIDPNGKYWYLSLAHGNPFGSLVKYSTETNKPISSTKLGLFPASMQISPITGLLYCVNFNLHVDMKPSTVSVFPLIKHLLPVFLSRKGFDCIHLSPNSTFPSGKAAVISLGDFPSK